MDSSRLLIRVSQPSGMEEDYVQNTLVHHLRHERTRHQRKFQILVVATLLVISAVLALLVAAVLGGRGHHSPDSKNMMQPYSHFSGINTEQQQHIDFERPSAMLTVPRGKNNDGGRLKWESEDGNAYCRGGFNYSSGNLVVPRGGVYRVFLQITFESMKEACCSGGLKLTNIVYLYRENYRKNVTILSSVDTMVCSVQPWSKSLYTAGLFLLDANSILGVTSSHPELIATSEYLVFFGAELVSQ